MPRNTIFGEFSYMDLDSPFGQRKMKWFHYRGKLLTCEFDRVRIERLSGWAHQKWEERRNSLIFPTHFGLTHTTEKEHYQAWLRRPPLTT